VALTAGSQLGPYEILAPLGAGGMGEVYRARDPRLGREVAIKVLPEAFSHDPARLARFDREARALEARPETPVLWGCGSRAAGRRPHRSTGSVTLASARREPGASQRRVQALGVSLPPTRGPLPVPVRRPPPLPVPRQGRGSPPPRSTATGPGSWPVRPVRSAERLPPPGS